MNTELEEIVGKYEKEITFIISKMNILTINKYIFKCSGIIMDFIIDRYTIYTKS